MKIIDELKKRFKGLSLGDIEKDALVNLNNSVKSRREFILTLYYLNFTKRFRENPAYKKATFETYINDKFHLRISTYEDERWAFIRYEEDSVKFGPGLISSIKRKCGGTKIRAVLDKINKAEKAHKKPLSRSMIQKIVESNALPETPRADKISYSVLEKDLSDARDVIRDLRRMLSEKDEQIKKLKLTVNDYKDRYHGLLAVVDPVVAAVSNVADRPDAAVS